MILTRLINYLQYVYFYLLQKRLCHCYYCYRLYFLFFMIKKKGIKIIFYLNALFVVAWLLKSLLVSGCLIYPVNKTCLGSLIFYDEGKTLHEAKSGEAWSKDWVNQIENKLQYDEYNKNFNWLDTWKRIILKKLLKKFRHLFFFFFCFY